MNRTSPLLTSPAVLVALAAIAGGIAASLAIGCGGGAPPSPIDASVNDAAAEAARRSAGDDPLTLPPVPPLDDAGCAAPANDADAASDDAPSDAADDGPNLPWPTRAFGVSEIMFDPTGTQPDDEWIEVYNDNATPQRLDGLILVASNGRQHRIGSSAIIGAKSFGVLVRSAERARQNGIPASAILYEYGAGIGSTAGIVLANGDTGIIEITLPSGTVIGKVAYGTFGIDRRGSSLEYGFFADGDEPSSWCLGRWPWADGGADRGTPGSANDCLSPGDASSP